MAGGIRNAKWLRWLFALPVALLAVWLGATAEASVYTLSSAVQGTAVNSTNVIGAGSSGATAVNLSSGTQTGLGGGLTGTIDAGQYSDSFTMYLDNTGNLRIINNYNGTQFSQTYNVGSDAFGVSGAINVGGTNYAILGGATSGIRVLNLANGQMTAVAGTFGLTSAQGLDAFMRPGGTTLDDIAIGIELHPTQSRNTLDIYGSESLLGSFNPGTVNGTPQDVSFDLENNCVWFGTSQGKIYDKSFDFSAYAVASPEVRVSATNGVVVVNWTGRQLWAAPGLTNWAVVATAPMTANQIFPPAAYAEPATNATRFFRSSW